MPTARKLPLFLLSLSIFIGFTFFFVFKKVNNSFGTSAKLQVYSDSINNEWEDWSWGQSVNFDNPIPVVSGNKSIWAKLDPWGAIYLHSKNLIDAKIYKSFRIAIQKTNENQKFQLLVFDSSFQPLKTLNLSKYTASEDLNKFNSYEIPIADLGDFLISGIGLQDATGAEQQPFFVDNIELSAIEDAASNTSGSIDNVNYYQILPANGFVSWSWGGQANFEAGNSINGDNEIYFSASTPWSGLYIHNDKPITTKDFDSLHFSIKPSVDNQNIKLVLFDINNKPMGNYKFINNWVNDYYANNWKEVDIPLSEIDPDSQDIKGIAFQEASGQGGKYFSIAGIRLNGVKISTSVNLPSPAILNTIVGNNPTTFPTNTDIEQGFYTKAGEIYKNGSKINIKGVNWFGFETGSRVPHGLWSRNYKDMIAQISDLGFNAVRLPVCPQSLRGVSVNTIDYSINPDLKGLNSIEIMDRITTELDNKGIYFLIDHHRPDCDNITELWYNDGYSEEDWIDDLQAVAKRYKNNKSFIGIDLKNEPHGSATWGTGNKNTDWNLAAERAGSKVLSVNPDILIFVAGIGNSSLCSGDIGHSWGGNFEPVNCMPISQTAIPKNKLVYTPHVYGPEVFFHSYFADPNFPYNMPLIWDKHFGFLKDAGYAVAIGEWGGRYGTASGEIKEIQFLDKLTEYFINKRICNSFYWSLNPNSGDTGGVLEDDWNSVWPQKMKLINNYFSNCR